MMSLSGMIGVGGVVSHCCCAQSLSPPFLPSQPTPTYTHTHTHTRTHTHQVDITVEDQNDNIPEFGFSFFVYNISENSPVGTVLAPTLLATDGDEGTNGQVRYSISTGPFNVDENTGKYCVHLVAASCTCRYWGMLLLCMD